MKKSSRPYTLRKSRSILKWVYNCYRKKRKQLSPAQLETVEREMTSLDQAILNQEKESASQIASRLEQFAETHCKKTILGYAWELILALLFALIIATVVRQMWFELYEIPTGSMRPTFREQDHLTVTKTAFGINVPLETQHFYFDPELVQRTSVVIFSGDNLPLRDTNTTYFGIFPYTKRYIKRCLGKPGDSIYFYGGRLYGIDNHGNELVELRDSPWMHTLEYVPFLSFEGEMTSGSDQIVFLNQMHQHVGKLNFTRQGEIEGEVFNGKEWVKDQPLAQTSPHNHIETYSDIFGIRNYAMARLLTKQELKQQIGNIEGISDGILYLQLHHTPSLNFPKPLIQREGAGYNIGILSYSTVIPLQQRHLDALMDNLYTARFVVRDGRARRYLLDDQRFYPGSPSFPGVPDGTYEFYFGKASSIHWGGISTAVSKDNPIYSKSPNNVQKLFNLGIEMNAAYSPRPNNQLLFPHRYAYFRDGDLYLMGAPIIKKDDPTLIAFHRKEEERQAASTAKNPYVAFKDYGPPLKDGKIDIDFIRTFGVTIPEKHYLVLGDNHAMSADSRVFGFVPQNNLQGAPYWIIWPPGDRLGPPPQKPYPFMNIPRAIIWAIGLTILLCWYAYHRRSMKKPIFIKEA